MSWERIVSWAVWALKAYAVWFVICIVACAIGFGLYLLLGGARDEENYCGDAETSNAENMEKEGWEE